MAQKLVRIGIEVDRESHVDFDEWAESEGRSKRRHAEILFRKLLRLRKTNPDALKQLGILQTDQATT